jgi:hypothetical protein
MRTVNLFAAAAILKPAAVMAQPMPGMEMPGMEIEDHGAHQPSRPEPQPAPPSQPQEHAGVGHQMPAEGARMAHEMTGMAGALGAYPGMRDASGTAWQPDSSPMDGMHGRLGGWSTMLHGSATLVYDDQGGPRGGRRTFVESMLMGMASRPLGGGTLSLRGTLSLDPLMGRRGYPLLLGTGETADGRTELVDRQHPHDLFMELSASYSHPLGRDVSGFVYFGLPGEPALGPVTFMHRFSGMMNPEAPIAHHWLDSTHITFGVVTGGLVWRGVKLEASAFTGREPDQHRYDFDRPRFDSWSVRASWNPAPDWSLQISHGFIKSPEQLEPERDQHRTTASVSYNRPLGRRGNWQTTLAWGRNDNRPGRASNAWLLESALTLGRHTVFARGENVDKDKLFADDPLSPLHDRSFNVTNVSLGYGYTLPVVRHVALDVGGLVSRYALPRALDPVYGSSPTSFMLFARIKLADR